MIKETGDRDAAGKALKSTTGWSETSKGENGNGDDAYGFNALAFF